MKTKVLDTFALMVFFQDEPGAEKIENLILDAQQERVNLAMCVINLGEIWYSISRSLSAETADHYVQEILGMPIEIIHADWELTRSAAMLKTRGGISYADCFAAALAKQLKAEVVTGDKEFKLLDKEIKIDWL
jgi:ribonuclease VapC